ncbi:hypothetical protein [Parvibaculum sp.]|jgi:flagellar biosynthesis/type III secretory pathway protein FliH|uniref:hypothetical protein n=1 Tax=Parvibaculum sp. TaxID=2024848 RepID=UPI003C74F085
MSIRNGDRHHPYRFRVFHDGEEHEGITAVHPASFVDEATNERLIAQRVEQGISDARKQAYAEGRAAGFLEGQEAARSEQRAREAAALERIVEALATSDTTLRSSISEMERQMLSAMRALVRRLAPRLLEAGFFNRLEELMSEAFERIGDGVALELRLNPMDAAMAGERLVTLAEENGHTLEVIGIARIPQGSCDLRWGDGGVRFDARDLFEELSAVLDQNENFQLKEMRK